MSLTVHHDARMVDAFFCWHHMAHHEDSAGRVTLYQRIRRSECVPTGGFINRLYHAFRQGWEEERKRWANACDDGLCMVTACPRCNPEGKPSPYGVYLLPPLSEERGFDIVGDKPDPYGERAIAAAREDWERCKTQGSDPAKKERRPGAGWLQ